LIKVNDAEYSLDDLLWFLKVAQAGSLSRAATQLGVPKSTLSRRLVRIETSMGIALVHRNSRSFVLTDVGSRLVQQAAPLVLQLGQMTDALRTDSSAPKGLVRFSASGSFGRLVLIPLLSNYLLENAAVSVETELTDRRVSIIKEGFDFAIRIGDLPDSGLRSRRLGTVSRVLCAAPAYVARAGLPATPEDLAAHSCLIQSRTSQSLTLVSQDRKITVLLPARLIAGPSDNLLVPVKAGLGISALPEIQVAGLLRRGDLLRVLPDWEMPSFEVQILYPAQKRLPAATRSLVEFFVAQVPLKITQLLEQDPQSE
jgi:DNA-binding transcriptional LysR family regulator